MFPRAARVFVGVEVLSGVAYFLIPPSGLRAVAYCIVSLSMVAAVIVGVRRWKPAQPTAWYLIAAGQLLFSIGDAINYHREWVLKTEIPFPSVGDGFYLVFYPLLAAGLLLAVAVRRWRAGGTGVVASRLLAFGLFALMASDTVYGLSVLNSNWQIGGPVDAVWILYYVAVGLAALHPSMVSLSEPAQVNPRLTRIRLALLTGASLMAPAMLIIQAIRDEPIDVAVIAGGSVVLFLLTLTRMGGLASEVAMQTERKRAMQTVLRATEQERVRLAADLHDGPVQELTALRYGLTRTRNRI